MSTHQYPSSSSPRRSGRIVAIAALVTAAVVAVAGGVILTVDASRATPASSSSQGSDSVRTLQQELADLNFYEGPITGHEGPQTIAAIKDLQRAADLPQTGVMNSQTRAALITFLQQGDNVMNSTSL